MRVVCLFIGSGVANILTSTNLVFIDLHLSRLTTNRSRSEAFACKFCTKKPANFERDQCVRFTKSQSDEQGPSEADH